MKPVLDVVVANKSVEAADICTFELVDPEGAPLPAFSAGSHVDVFLDGGLTRQYSLCNAPSETHRYLIGVLRDPASRGGSAALHDRVREGDRLQISLPKNHFALAKEAHHSVLVAGGIGVTPLLCMAERLAVSGAGFEMHYCTRSRERAAFLDRIERAAFASSVHLHFDDQAASQRLDLPSLVAHPQAGTHLYVCGPQGLMNAVLEAARAAGWPEQQLHFEYFGGDVVRSDDDTGFEVQLASSGRVIGVTRDQTVLQALAAAGVEVPTSCEQGVCGTCLTRVLEGVPEHKDLYLTPDEQSRNDQMLVCCSRAKSARLVLDL